MSISSDSPPEPPPWTEQQMDDYEQARALLSAVIAAYSARIGASTNADETAKLRETRALYAIERRDLTAGHIRRVEEINRQFGALLESLRAGGR